MAWEGRKVRGAKEMTLPEQIVEVQLSRAALREGFRESGEEGSLIVPGLYELALGATINLRIGLEGQPCGVFIEAMVQSRRSASTSTRAGVGVRFLRSSFDAGRFAAQWANGQREPSGRQEWRYPVELSVILVSSPRGSTRIYPCTLLDVSMRGARASINHRIESGSELRCEWKSPFGSGAVTSRAVWGANGRLGLQHVFQKPEERVAWEQLLAKVRATLRERIVAPMRDNSRLSAGGIPAVGRERGFTPTPGGAAVPPGSGVNKVIPKLVEVPASETKAARKRDPRSEE